MKTNHRSKLLLVPILLLVAVIVSLLVYGSQVVSTSVISTSEPKNGSFVWNETCVYTHRNGITVEKFATQTQDSKQIITVEICKNLR